jgi:hypothetical protein
MDKETADAIEGAYAFARNVLVAVIADLIEMQASDERIERLLQRLGAANETTIPEGPSRAMADAQTSSILALARSYPRPPTEAP